MQKVVLKVDIHDDDSCKQKVLKMASSIYGLDSIAMDMKEKKLTVIGDMDPVAIVKKLRKNYNAYILSVGPAKEPEKKKDDPEKTDNKPNNVVRVSDYICYPMQAYNNRSNSYIYPHYYPVNYNDYVRIQENPNGCVIC